MEEILSFLSFYILPVVIISALSFWRFCRSVEFDVAQAFQFSDRVFADAGEGGCYGILKKLAKKARVNTPALIHMEGHALVTYAVRKDRSVVVVGKKDLELFNRIEMEAALAHELGHILNGHNVKAMLWHSVLLAIYFCAFVTFFALLLPALVADIFGRGPFFSDLLFLLRITVILTLLWVGLELVFRFYLRRREFQADEKAAELVEDPQKVIQALRRIEVLVLPGKRNFAQSAWKFLVFWVNRVADTHPSDEKRIARLEKLAREKANT